MSKLIWGGSSANMVPHILPSLHSSLHLKSNTCNVKVEIGQYKRWFTDPYPFFPSIDANIDVKDLKDRTNMPNIFDTLLFRLYPSRAILGVKTKWRNSDCHISILLFNRFRVATKNLKEVIERQKRHNYAKGFVSYNDSSNLMITLWYVCFVHARYRSM